MHWEPVPQAGMGHSVLWSPSRGIWALPAGRASHSRLLCESRRSEALSGGFSQFLHFVWWILQFRGSKDTGCSDGSPGTGWCNSPCTATRPFQSSQGQARHYALKNWSQDLKNKLKLIWLLATSIDILIMKYNLPELTEDLSIDKNSEYLRSLVNFLLVIIKDVLQHLQVVFEGVFYATQISRILISIIGAFILLLLRLLIVRIH